MTKSCVGIDMSKLEFHGAIKIQGKEKVKAFSNNERGFKHFLEWLQKNLIAPYHVCMESTGKYGNSLAEFLYNNGHVVSVVNPAKIKFFMKSQLSRNKTDIDDAVYILHFCELFNPNHWRPLSIEHRELQELTKRLDSLTEMKAQEKNRLENASDIIKESVATIIDCLTKEIKAIEAKIKIHINENSHFKEQARLLDSIKGIGDKTTNKVIAFLGNIEAYDRAKKLAAFIGLNPQRFQSGTSLNRSRLSKMGNAELRKMFYMPTLVAIKHNPVINAFYVRLIAKGKSKKVAICAAMRKLVHIIYGVLKNKMPFDATHA